MNKKENQTSDKGIDVGGAVLGAMASPGLYMPVGDAATLAAFFSSLRTYANPDSMFLSSA